ncbi:hypothetical protein SARC_02445 [Sphaeroforma arctica JP610]|uniref:Uncharacterized protein n=1 Tax=Sphaeroforma arctica JP610 TaxID=667725 RepID=A0A0L0GAR2_9EUKA|nr:hypothetical protein SARC_02445 [Sphaeroforma arctica JP610]KNC85353.1 hypothetical protein SARC_02445 [Sphaeroforma arctica JP610]|eukprot:XP_014159255.1 hypothetical protein SARC_02445 [Sphaeroforma arctica JP610]
MNVLTIFRVASGGDIRENAALTELQRREADIVDDSWPFIVGGGIFAVVLVAVIIMAPLIQQRASYRNIIKDRQARESLHSVDSSKEQTVSRDYSPTS